MLKSTHAFSELLDEVLEFLERKEVLKMSLVSTAWLAACYRPQGAWPRYLPVFDAALGALTRTNRFRSVESLDLSSSWITSVKYLCPDPTSPVGNFVTLRKLNLRSCVRLQAASLFRLSFLPLLEELILDECHRIDTVSSLSTCPSLKNLSLVACSSLTDRGIMGLEEIATLQILNLKACSKITSVEHLKDSRSLRVLNLDKVELLSDAGIRGLERIPTLQEVSFDRNRLVTRVSHLGASSSLQKVTFARCSGLKDESGLGELSRCASLLELEISANTGTGAGSPLNHLSQLGNSTSLKKISVPGLTLLDIVTVTYFAQQIPTLQALDLTQVCKGFASYVGVFKRSSSSSSAHVSALKSLNLSQCSTVCNVTVSEIAESLMLLEELKLVECTRLTTVASLSRLKKLRSLDVASCSQLDDVSFGPVEGSTTSTFAALEHLDMSRCNKVTSLASIAEACPQLSTLILRDCSGLTNEGILLPLSRLQQLDALTLSGCKEVSRISEIMTRLLRFKKIGLAHLPAAALPTDHAPTSSSSPPPRTEHAPWNDNHFLALEELDLSGWPHSAIPSFLQHLLMKPRHATAAASSSPPLCLTIDLSSSAKLTNEGLPALAERIESSPVRTPGGPRFTVCRMKSFGAVPTMRYPEWSQGLTLDLSRCKLVSSLERLGPCVWLTTLRLNDCDALTDSGVSIIGKMSSLERVEMDGCKNVTSLMHLRNLKRLRYLRAMRCAELDSDGLSGLEDAPLLEVLNVMNCPGVRCIGFLGRSASLQRLLASNTSVDDSGLLGLERAPRLCMLFLQNCRWLTSVACLSKARSLALLAVSGCAALTDKGVARLTDSPSLVSFFFAGCAKITTGARFQHLAAQDAFST